MSDDLNGWEPALCWEKGEGENPQVFFEYKLKPGSVSIYEKDGLLYVRKNSSEHIADGVPYSEADEKIFENFNIHAPDPEKMSKYGVRVCG